MKVKQKDYIFEFASPAEADIFCEESYPFGVVFFFGLVGNSLEGFFVRKVDAQRRKVWKVDERPPIW